MRRTENDRRRRGRPSPSRSFSFCCARILISREIKRPTREQGHLWDECGSEKWRRRWFSNRRTHKVKRCVVMGVRSPAFGEKGEEAETYFEFRRLRIMKRFRPKFRFLKLCVKKKKFITSIVLKSNTSVLNRASKLMTSFFLTAVCYSFLV